MGLARWENHHPIHWEVLDHGRGQELLVKEALHIKMTPSEDRSTESLVAGPLGGAILADL